MDYSTFVHAVQKDDRATLNVVVPAIRSVLHRFLLVRFNASYEDAEDVIQNTLMYVCQRIREGEIRDPDQIINYLLSAVRNQYLNQYSRVRMPVTSDFSAYYVAEPDQLNNLLNSEKNAVVAECLSELRPPLREFITCWFAIPGCDAQTVADRFGITVNNAWTKKHRILQILHTCVQKKLNR